MSRNAIGNAIREQRQRLGLSQAAVAQATGIERSHITRIEGGRWVPRIETLARIAKALRTSVEALVSSKRPAA